MTPAVLDRDAEAMSGSWVEAAPFRAHLRHLMTVGQMSSSSVAVLAGVSPRFAHRLIHGRGGRPLKRIAPDTARKLLRVTATEARAVRSRLVPARATAEHLRQLRSAGWSDDQLAGLLGATRPAVAALIADDNGTCTQLMALRAAAQASQLLSPLPGKSPGAQAA